MNSSTSQSNLPFTGHPNGHRDGGSTNQFGCSAQELSELLELDNREATLRVREQYGGIRELCRHLKTSPTTGLSGSLTDLQIRAKTFGLNVWESFVPVLWNATWDITIGILMATEVISFAFSFVPREFPRDFETGMTHSASDWIEHVALFVIILLIVLAIALIEWFKQHCAGEIQHVRKCTVIRGGQYVEIPTKEIVVGDICDISYGNIVPASGFLLHGSGVRVKVGLPDGTVQTVEKDVLSDSLVHSGSHVVGGSGRMVITKVGPNVKAVKKLFPSFDQKNQKTDRKVHDCLQHDSQRMKLSLLEEEHSDAVFHIKRKSMLETKLRLLTVRLCYAGIAGTVLLTGAFIVQLSLRTFVIGKETSIVDFVHDFVKCLLLVAAAAVVIVPVRLPAGLVLVFAQTLKRMQREGVLVQNLGALENAAYITDVIISKTGTISTNQTSVAQVFLGGHMYNGPSAYHKIPDGIRSLLVRLMSLSTEYGSQVEGSGKGVEGQRRQGDSRDCALLKFVLDLCQSYRTVRELTPSDHFVWICPFDSTRKFNIKVIPYGKGGYQVLTKGAAEVLLGRCSSIVDGDGNTRLLNFGEVQSIVQNVVRPMSAMGLTTICLAYKNYVSGVPKQNEECASSEPNWEDEESVMSNLTCVAIFGVEDPLIDKLPELVRKCHMFGIGIRLVTGEDSEAAESVAIKCGIVKDRSKLDILEGKSFEAQIRRIPTGPVVPEYFNSVWHQLRVVARASPENRLSIVHFISEFLSKMQSQVIACVGKDLADVPSLLKADVGFSMVNVGSDVTREAADIILKHDGLSGIVRCIIWSRCIQENIRKLLQFQLTSIAVTFFTVLIGVCVFNESPLQAIHLLWIKMILDSLAAVALASEQPMEKFGDCQSSSRHDSLFSRSVGKNVILHSLYQINVVLSIFFTGEYFIDMEEEHGHKHGKMSSKNTTIFNTCILMMLFNEINARMLNGGRNMFYQIYCSYVFAGLWIGSFVIQVIIVQFGGSAFSTVALTLEQWGWCLFFGIGELLWCQVIAFLPACEIFDKRSTSPKDIRQMEQNSKALWEAEDDDSFDDSHLGMMLWKHGLTRLQNQLRVARAFKNILDSSSEPRSSRGSLEDDPDLGDPADRLPGRHWQSFSTHSCFYPQLHPRDRDPAEIQRMQNVKSRSADNVLFDPWISGLAGNWSNQMDVPRCAKVEKDPYETFYR